MHRSNQRAKLMNQPLLLVFALVGFGFSIHGQPSKAQTSEPKVIIRLEEFSPEKEEPVLPSSPPREELSGSADCEQKYPMPENMKIKKFDQKNDANVCARLVLQGQRLRCEVDKLTSEQSNISAKTELTNWARCNEKIANVLTNGYYLPASEIERRLQICRSNFFADPGSPQKLGDGVFDRLVDLVKEQFMQWVKSINPRLAGSATVQLPITLQNEESFAGLMQCEWMFATSKPPQIDPLPSLAPTGTEPPAKSPNTTKPPVRKPAN